MLLRPQTKDPLLRGFHLTDAVIQAHLVDMPDIGLSRDLVEKTAWEHRVYKKLT